MDEKLFDELLESVGWMGKHARGETQSSRTFEYRDPDVRAIRRDYERRLSQAAQPAPLLPKASTVA